MKKVLFFILFCLTTTFVSAQVKPSAVKEDKHQHIALEGKKVKRIPPAVQVTFQQEHPRATQTQWFKKKGVYKVLFTVDNDTHIAVYDQEGKRLD